LGIDDCASKALRMELSIGKTPPMLRGWPLGKLHASGIAILSMYIRCVCHSRRMSQRRATLSPRNTPFHGLCIDRLLLRIARVSNVLNAKREPLLSDLAHGRGHPGCQGFEELPDVFTRLSRGFDEEQSILFAVCFHGLCIHRL